MTVFPPVYFFVVIPFPFFDRIRANEKVKAFVAGVTAAASGTIAGASFVLVRRAIIDGPTLLIAPAILGIIWPFKVPEPLLRPVERKVHPFKGVDPEVDLGARVRHDAPIAISLPKSVPGELCGGELKDVTATLTCQSRLHVCELRDILLT